MIHKKQKIIEEKYKRQILHQEKLFHIGKENIFLMKCVRNSV